MERWAGKVAIVTGASSGIGEALAESLVNHGMKVVGLGRREEKLKEIEKRFPKAKGKFYAFKADITKEEDIFNAYRWTESNLGAIHVVVNNAGIVQIKKLQEQEPYEWRQIYDTNLLALQISSVEAVKSMKKHNVTDGHIINISSINAIMSSPSPERATYYASKKAASALTEGLRVELASERSDIRVTTITPGLVNTEIFDQLKHKIPEEIVQLGLKPIDVVQTVLFALQVPSHVLISELVVQPIRNIKLEVEHLRKMKQADK